MIKSEMFRSITPIYMTRREISPCGLDCIVRKMGIRYSCIVSWGIVDLDQEMVGFARI